MGFWIVAIIIVIVVVCIVAAIARKDVKKKARKIIADGKITNMKEYKYICSQLDTEAGDLLSTGRLEAKDLWEKLQKLNPS